MYAHARTHTLIKNGTAGSRGRKTTRTGGSTTSCVLGICWAVCLQDSLCLLFTPLGEGSSSLHSSPQSHLQLPSLTSDAWPRLFHVKQVTITKPLSLSPLNQQAPHFTSFHRASTPWRHNLHSVLSSLHFDPLLGMIPNGSLSPQCVRACASVPLTIIRPQEREDSATCYMDKMRGNYVKWKMKSIGKILHDVIYT